MLKFTIDLSSVTSWEEFVTAFNEGFIRQVGGEWAGNLDSFNDYLWWPDEHPFRLVIRGWHRCMKVGNFQNTWNGRPVLEVVAEIFRDNLQGELVIVEV